MVLTFETLRILSAFKGGARRHGYAVVGETGLKVGVVYPALYRLRDAGLLASETERVDPSLSSRAPRTIYRQTKAGEDRLRVIREMVST